MIYPVYFTPIAQERVDSIVAYLKAIWGEKTKNEFITELVHCKTLISINPTLFPLFEEYEDIRRCVINRHNCLFYKIMNDCISILTVWDNRIDIDTFKAYLSSY
jgi:plasmid stabilization system protein ParE